MEDNLSNDELLTKFNSNWEILNIEQEEDKLDEFKDNI